MPKFDEFLFGKSGKSKKQSLTSPLQDQLLELINQGLTEGKGPLADIFGEFNEEEFNKGIVNPALKNFKENILPQLQESFSGGDFGGSGMIRAQNKAGVDLQSKLAELMYGAQNQQKQNRLAGVQTGLNKQTHENTYQPATQGIAQDVIKQGVKTGANLIGGAIAG